MDDIINSDFDVLQHIVPLLVAYILAIPIGWNREKEDRSAGLRTFPLVALASCGFIESVDGITDISPEATARILEGIMTGIGFIGGGAILRLGTTIHGTATAASLWVTGAIGAAVGLGQIDVAVALSAITFLSFLVLRPFKQDGNDSAEPGMAGEGAADAPGDHRGGMGVQQGMTQ